MASLQQIKQLQVVLLSLLVSSQKLGILLMLSQTLIIRLHKMRKIVKLLVEKPKDNATGKIAKLFLNSITSSCQFSLDCQMLWYYYISFFWYCCVWPLYCSYAILVHHRNHMYTICCLVRSRLFLTYVQYSVEFLEKHFCIMHKLSKVF